ncbi:hypothetical protein HETIRDRAFT_163700 [Heterobasidion irregulare TC 32-1]|uniref:Uncharacterized protein n=1 Tax=Heterobasidion irregulare (strain TC 32-1) TaxID=747525 RepID=W4JVY5_HETIT|nr:uncharacterized protein HETIRDRAFT_163700 [Heterobasidion irregulare TC 32-1]ETW77712.1 hypothetical protein HETIRDRAFT_163700 [Heterobasidion irregulare TC 32-1]
MFSFAKIASFAALALGTLASVSAVPAAKDAAVTAPVVVAAPVTVDPVVAPVVTLEARASTPSIASIFANLTSALEPILCTSPALPRSPPAPPLTRYPSRPIHEHRARHARVRGRDDHVAHPVRLDLPLRALRPAPIRDPREPRRHRPAQHRRPRGPPRRAPQQRLRHARAPHHGRGRGRHPRRPHARPGRRRRAADRRARARRRARGAPPRGGDRARPRAAPRGPRPPAPHPPRPAPALRCARWGDTVSELLSDPRPTRKADAYALVSGGTSCAGFADETRRRGGALD